MQFDLKTLRQNYRLSQVKLAHESGVSLPTIQNIEMGKGNPTLDVLEKLLKAFGLQIQVYHPPFDANLASALGVPLSSNSFQSSKLINSQTLKVEARKWLHLLAAKELNERDELAVIAFLKGVQEHYPSFYKKEISAQLFDQLIEKYSHLGKIIKLRRIALANMSHYL